MAVRAETVVLVPGLWIPAWALRLLQRRLSGYGFAVHLFSYPTRRDLQRNADRLHDYIAALHAPALHLVGYSLGGVLIRALFHFHPQQPPGRIVTLGTPHIDCHVGRALSSWRPLRRLLGEGIGAVVAGEPQTWALPERAFGTLAGSMAIGAGRLVVGLPKPNDGTVAECEAHLPGAADTLTLKVSHTGMLFSPEVARQTAYFLWSGRFSR